jgi:hypothetical protein
LGITGEFLGGVATKPHKGAGKDRTDLLQVERQVLSVGAGAHDLIAITPLGRKDQEKQLIGEAERRRRKPRASFCAMMWPIRAATPKADSPK